MSGPDSVSAIEADIAATREDLARTVDQLTAKADVPARIRGRVQQAPSWLPPALVAGTAAAAIGLVVLAWRRRAGRGGR